MSEKTYPTARIEALGDSIFGVAMTLLALDVRFAENFEPKDSGAFLAGVVALFPKFLPYALSFWVLGLRWLAMTRVRNAEEYYGDDYGKFWLLYLFLVTCIPFTTIAVGRYAHLPPAVWFYAGNTALLGAVALILAHRTPGARDSAALHERKISSAILIASSLVATGLSFVASSNALWAFGLNFLAPAITRWTAKRGSE